MRTRPHSRHHPRQGYALLLTLCMISVSLLLLAATTRWTWNECSLTARNNLYNTTVAAAEAATENVLAHMERDFVRQSVASDLSAYSALIPSQSGWPTQFKFSDGSGNEDHTGVESTGPTVVTDLNSEFTGLYGLVAPYQVVSKAVALNESHELPAAVQQNFQLARIPIFQFAIFYAMDLEINPGAAMTVNGKVHGNANLYAAPPASLTFKDAVTAVGDIYNDRHPNDPTGGSKTAPIYQDKHVSKVSALTLPVGTNNSPEAVQQILDVPLAGENAQSELGKQRFFNNADLIVSNSPAGQLTVKSGLWDGFATLPPDVTSGTNTWYSFVTNTTFYDYREKKTVRATEVDVGKLRTWMASAAGGLAANARAKTALNHELNSIYVVDSRLQTAASLTAVRAANARVLPNDGLTVASPQPLYVKGHYNLNENSTTPGNQNTAKTEASALIGDAITILSDNWSDNYTSSTALSSRPAANTTVNAAILSGIVCSTQIGTSKYYSGGVENFPRFLENWSGITCTYNGSMVVMFPSRYATSFWKYGDPVYNAPTRRWAFDINFLDPNRLPPMAPPLRQRVRGQWQGVAIK